MATIKARSDSSLSLRERLKRQVVLPEVNDRVSLDRYLAFAEPLLASALQYLSRGELSTAYVELVKLLSFLLERLPKHSQYRAMQNYDQRKKWCAETARQAMTALEETTRRMDEREDELRREREREREREMDLFLIEQLEEEESKNNNNNRIINDNRNSNSNSKRNTVSEHKERDARYRDDDNDSSAISAISSSDSVRSLDCCFGCLSVTDVDVQLLASGNDRLQAFRTADKSSDSKGGDSKASGSTAGASSKSRSSLDILRKDTAPSSSSSSSSSAPLQSSLLVAASKPSAAHAAREKYRLRCTGPEEIEIVMHIIAQKTLTHIPLPATTLLELSLSPSVSSHSNKTICFLRDDFHISFAGFLQFLPAHLQVCRAAVETNRCFFIHLGIAVGLHPFLLQVAFRELAAYLSSDPDCWFAELVQTVSQYAGLVDANALCFLWPKELSRFRLLFVSGSNDKPIFASFTPQTSSVSEREGLVEIALHCNGTHFTLLRPHPSLLSLLGESQKAHPQRESPWIDGLLRHARAAGAVVQEYVAQPPAGLPSVEDIVRAML